MEKRSGAAKPLVRSSSKVQQAAKCFLFVFASDGKTVTFAYLSPRFTTIITTSSQNGLNPFLLCCATFLRTAFYWLSYRVFYRIFYSTAWQIYPVFHEKGVYCALLRFCVTRIPGCRTLFFSAFFTQFLLCGKYTLFCEPPVVAGFL